MSEIVKSMPAKPAPKLRELRCVFTQCLARLILKMQEFGRDCALAEGMDRKTAKDPTTDHMKCSLHEIGLAQDIDLYTKDGTYLDKTDDHKVFGEWWEKQHPLARWGGRFSDGNHYSFEYQGKK